MTAIGIDTHKATLAACAVDALGTPLEERTFANDPAGHRALAALGPACGTGGHRGCGGLIELWRGRRPLPGGPGPGRARGPAAALAP